MMKLVYFKILLLIYSALTVQVSFADDVDVFPQATKLKAQGRYIKANYYYYKAIKENININEALYELSDSLYHSRDFKNSLVKLSLLLKQDPAHERALLLRSRIYTHQQQHAKALSGLEQLERTNPGADVFILLDSVYTAVGNHAAAEKAKAAHRVLISSQQSKGKE